MLIPASKAGDGRLPGARSGAYRWGVSLGATAVSTYLLDVTATTAGLLLVASQLLEGAPNAVVILFLVSSYLVWAAGLRVNLGANWSLLERTGTSTNILSKAAHSVVRSRTGSVRARRIAADLGYLGSELAKESPYYLGAFGAALFSESVSANEALVFLGGANLGAAGYEYGLARIVRALLNRRRSGSYASFESDWNAGDYLATYYRAVEADERRTIAFFVEGMKQAEPDEAVLVFGVGPTLHHVFLAAERASEIHLGEFLPANLREIEWWIRRDARAHDWRSFVEYTLACERPGRPTPEAVTLREELTRDRIDRLLAVDLRTPRPLGNTRPRVYATVISAYCADSATNDPETWRCYMHRIVGLVRPGGTFMTAALRRSSGYRVGSRLFPSANIDEDDIRDLLERYFEPADLVVEAHEVSADSARGYSSIVLARGYRKRDAGPPVRGHGATALA